MLKEIVEPAGAIIYANKFELGDPTINALELWGAEYQENNAILCDEKDLELLNKISLRERCPVLPVGIVTNDGKVSYINNFCIRSFKINHFCIQSPKIGYFCTCCIPVQVHLIVERCISK